MGVAVVGMGGGDITVSPPSENLLALLEKKDPIPLPHPPNGVAVLCEAVNSGATTWGEAVCGGSGGVFWITGGLFELAVLLIETVSESLPNSGVPRPDSGGVAGPPALDVRDMKRPLTPPTALKKFVEPVTRDLEMASRAGVSCWTPS